jgi:hypothetical protein
MNLLRRRRKKTQKSNLKRYIILLFSFIMSTFAWFTYNKVLNNNLNLHVLAWDIVYKIDGVEQTNPMNISTSVPLYPGMKDQDIKIDIINNGEVDVDINYYLESMTIIGNEYTINNTDVIIERDEKTISNEINPGEKTINNGLIEQDILNNTQEYPFSIKVKCSSVLTSLQKGYMEITISWPETCEDDKDSAEDEIEIKNKLDTKWAYDFTKYYLENQDAKAIEMTIQINATQKLTTQ